jgi:single-strand DNA-binding protein
MQINDVKIAGNLVRDPEVRHTPNGTPVANLSLGVDEFVQVVDDMKKKVTTFVDVQIWGKNAENLASLVHKCQEIFVEGALRQDTWDDKDTGKSRSKLFVKANSWQFTQYKASEELRREAAKTQARGMER